MTPILLILIVSFADPNMTIQDFAAHYGEPAAVIEYVWYKPAESEPNLLLKMVFTECVPADDFNDLTAFAIHDDPNGVRDNPTWWTVYLALLGSRYHEKGCRYAAFATETFLIEAILKGKTPCRVCKPIFYKP